MNRLRRLTKGARFEVVTDLEGSYAVLYGENKLSGQWQRVGSCHMTVLDYICEHGAKQALQQGLIKLDSPADHVMGVRSVS